MKEHGSENLNERLFGLPTRDDNIKMDSEVPM